MSLFALTKRFQLSTPSTHSSLLFINSITYLSSFHPPLNFPTDFTCPFHRTSSKPHRFSTFHTFLTQTLTNPFPLHHHKISSQHPLEQSLLSSFKNAVSLQTEKEAMACLDTAGIEANNELVYSVIWELNKDWRMAFLAFKWGQKYGCVDEEVCELIVWVLSDHRKFSVAWRVIGELLRSKLNTRRSMLIMIDRYAAASDPKKAIQTFSMIEKFRLAPDEEAFYYLLTALCKYGNIEEAEEFMLVKKKLFPLTADGFTIILNGWCNIIVDVLEAKRIWREMSKCCITPNADSYACMISCFSKVGNLFGSLRLYDEMKKKGFVPGIDVYHSLVHVLSRENCYKQALKIVDNMKEAGLKPNSTTYNLMIRSLCEAKQLVEASDALNKMVDENISPTVETYHAFLDGTSFSGTSKILDRMTMAGVGPTEDTFLLVLSKFFKLKQPEDAFKMWAEMDECEVRPDSRHYVVLVEGLARSGFSSQAREFYAEMLSNGFPDDPKFRKILKKPEGNKNDKT